MKPPVSGIGVDPLPGGALEVETVGMTMRFGAFTALEDVSIRVAPGSFHALLGENGAGKSTLVKCIMGFYHATSGQLLVGRREAEIADPRDARALGLGMVYQHFTLVPSLSVAENLVISRADAPVVIDWAKERGGWRRSWTRCRSACPWISRWRGWRRGKSRSWRS